MAVKKDESGRRFVSSEVEVPGTPEQVWEAIATGPGITAWFAPVDMEEREGGKIVFHMGPGMDGTATITTWEPPNRLVADDDDWLPNGPIVATEWTIEARSGGTCLVRVVHSLFADTDDWDTQLESTEVGWPSFFRILKLYLEYFPGQSCTSIRLLGGTSESEADAWKTLTEPLGLANATVGERRTAPDSGAPRLSGVVEHAGSEKWLHDLLLRIDEPAQGVAAISAYTWGGSVHGTLSLYLYGDDVAAVAAREEPRWREWMAERFPQAPTLCLDAAESTGA